MILVGQYDSPYVRRVGVSLHLLGLAYQRNTISGFADAEEMRRINPLGRIPGAWRDGEPGPPDRARWNPHLRGSTVDTARMTPKRLGRPRRS